MRLERYREDDMRKAMSRVRTDLGADAVIISSRRINGSTEVMAAIDYDPEQLETEMRKFALKQPKTKPTNDKRKINSELLWEIIDDKPIAEPIDDHSALVEMQEELGKLRKLFEGELAQLTWRDEGKRQPNRLALISRLEVANISRDIAAAIVDKVLPCADLELGWRRVLRMLSRNIKISSRDVLQDGGVIALVGATGVGKTTTAAKIAAQFTLRHGKNKVAFITTDNSRVGGQEQLISLASTLGVPVQVATTREEMQNTLASLCERKLVIIDTAGISQRDTSLLERYKSLLIGDLDIQPYLVLSATAQESVINETIRAYSSIDLAAAIITKTDESPAIGPVLSGLIRNKLAISFTGNGQKIPEDLLPANIENFIGNIVESYANYKKIKTIRNLKIKNKKEVHV